MVRATCVCCRETNFSAGVIGLTEVNTAGCIIYHDFRVERIQRITTYNHFVFET